MRTIVFAMPGNDTIAPSIADSLGISVGALQVRHFPDGESYVRFETPIEGQGVILVCTLDRPDEKLLPLIFAAAAARDLGAIKVGLVAPYLAYMRQDRRFQPGEAITSTYFARMLGSSFDWLVTVDPHLHRRNSLSEIYSVPALALRAAAAISAWIRQTIQNPVLIGPDGESAQWVAAVANDANAPFLILEKTRRGDRDVEVSVPDVERWRDRTPVLVDDIISTAHTMIETVGHLRAAALPPPVCISVHGIFAGHAYEDLRQAGAERIVTCNTITHPSNAIDISALFVEGVRNISA